MTARARINIWAYVRIGLAGVALGTWSLFVRAADLDPLWAGVLVFGGIASLAGVVLLWRERQSDGGSGPRRRSDWRDLLVLGGLNAGATWLYFTAILSTDVSIAVSAHCLTPVFVAIGAPWVLGTPRQTRSLWLAFMALGGVILIMAPWRHTANATEMAAMVGGGVWGGGSAVLNSGVLLLNKRLSCAFRPEERLAYPAALAAVLLLPAALWLRMAPPDFHGVIYLLVGAALVGFVGGWLFLTGLNDVPAEHAGILTLWEPLTGLLIAAFVWNERVGALGVLGASITVLAGILAIREPRTG